MTASVSQAVDPVVPLPAQSRRYRLTGPVVAAVLMTALVAVAVFAPAIAPVDPDSQSLLNRFTGPSANFLLGTDEFGRDQLSRLIFGTRTTLLATLLATSIAVVLGLPFGLLAGYVGGWADAIASRITEAIQVVPSILLALAVVAALGRGLTNAMIAIGVVFAPRIFRIVRAATVSASRETFVEASRISGGPTGHILLRHVMPTILSPLLVQVTLLLAISVLAEAALSFLGLGVQPPQASWGSMLGSAISYMEQAPHLVIVPGFLITVTVLCFNTLGAGILRARGGPGGSR